MIRLQKLAEPQVLADNAVKWTEELLAELANNGDSAGVRISKYSHTDIKKQIVAETHGKCLYCEAKILHDQYGDIEHYFPKSLDPNLAFDWRNLSLACRKCNGNKSDRDPMVQGIIDPYEADPEQDLGFYGPLIYSKSQDGEETCSILSLDRPELNERRGDVLTNLMKIIARLYDARLALAAKKAIYDDFVANELKDSAQYASMARSLHALLGPSLEALLDE